MEQYPQKISSLYAAVSDFESELIVHQAKLLATTCNPELQGSAQPCYSCKDIKTRRRSQSSILSRSIRNYRFFHFESLIIRRTFTAPERFNAQNAAINYLTEGNSGKHKPLQTVGVLAPYCTILYHCFEISKTRWYFLTI